MEFDFNMLEGENAIPTEYRPLITQHPTLSFRGTERDAPKLKAFMTDMMYHMGTFPWPNDTCRLVYFKRHLAGPAANWATDYMHSNPWENVVFTDFLNKFWSHFYTTPDYHKTMNALAQLSEAKLGIEKLNQEFSKLRRTLPANFWSEEASIAAYEGRLTKSTRNGMRAMRPKNLKEAMEEAYQCLAPTERALPGYELDHEGDTIIAPVYSSKPAKQTQNRSNRGKKPSREDCIRKQLCFYCKKEGHRLNECRARQASSNRH